MTSRWTGGRPRPTTSRTATTTQETGLQAEQAARRYLQAAGLGYVARNVRYRLGEIDLVMRDGSCLVFVEVRFRASRRFVAPLLTVDRRKQQRIARAAALFLASRRRFASAPVRFDVVAVERAEDGRAAIQWVRDAFRV